MLVENTLYGMVDRVKVAIKRIREFEPEDGYYVAFSGGKDSIVIKDLVKKSGARASYHYCVTTIDPPELVYFMKKYHKDVRWDRPKRPFLMRIVEKGFPMRQHRWCCGEYKERCGKGRFVVTGIRWAESARRRKRRMVESCYKGGGKRYLHVIIDWSDDDVWEYIRREKLPYCKLYDEGWKRLGCIGCPFSDRARKEFKRWPGYERAFRGAFRKLHEKRKAKGLKSVERWNDGDEMFDWWIDKNRTAKRNEKELLLPFDN